MKTIGLIGGTGWVSTVEYYKLINEGINKKLGGLNSAQCFIYSFNYAEIDTLVKKDDLDAVYELVLEKAKKLKACSVDCLILCANTLHQYVDKLEKTIGLPIVHIADATAKVIKQKGLTKVGLLGTRFTMEMDFYTKRLSSAGIETIVPEKPQREFIHDAIINEMLHDNFKDETRKKFLSIIDDLKAMGTGGIVLGCTEIPLLIKQEDVELPLFSTLEIHAEAIVDYAVG
ncbi:MAG: aspartate/glutamate racemase family protein [Ignavibacteriaceae bacterium]|nr:aspartate/glutamate racemase family protein [Ignavibacteriaceae bacterium]